MGTWKGIVGFTLNTIECLFGVIKECIDIYKGRIPSTQCHMHNHHKGSSFRSLLIVLLRWRHDSQMLPRLPWHFDGWCPIVERCLFSKKVTNVYKMLVCFDGQLENKCVYLNCTEGIWTYSSTPKGEKNIDNVIHKRFTVYSNGAWVYPIWERNLRHPLIN